MPASDGRGRARRASRLRPPLVAGGLALVGGVAAIGAASVRWPIVQGIGVAVAALGIGWAAALITTRWFGLAFSPRYARAGFVFALLEAGLFGLAMVAGLAGQERVATALGGLVVGLWALVVVAALVVNGARLLRWRPPSR